MTLLARATIDGGSRNSLSLEIMPEKLEILCNANADYIEQFAEPVRPDMAGVRGVLVKAVLACRLVAGRLRVSSKTAFVKRSRRRP